VLRFSKRTKQVKGRKLMSMLLDDAAFGGQVMVGAGQPVALGVGAGRKN
jgi:TPP-dependent pyruvate/acetoin dehydrogenase alpha subunit